ncbi:hypothetical protein [Candidatus Nitrosopumilus salaria]|uniref:hypothetical protein n=1 Tax=Candidatus Nitrosopumilus salarius TaxID=1170320 RepID=UPI00064E4E0B|nr:hypothetical protein [Candidatus Nitrosopumilus salaria]
MLIFNPIVIQNLFAEPYMDTDYSKRIEIITALQEKPSPKQQLSDRIFAADIVCSNDFVLVLKLSAIDKVACVSIPTAEKLVERNWGIIRTDNVIIGGTFGECKQTFEIFFDKGTDFRKSQLIKHMRISLSEFSNEKALWGPISISSQSNEEVWISIDSCFYSENELSKILNDFKELDYVKDAKVEIKEI